MEFYSAIGYTRPTRLCHATRKFASESLNGKYGKQALETPSVSLDHIPNFSQLSTLKQYDTAIYEIVTKAPLRLIDGERICGAATLGLAINHVVPATYHNEVVFGSVSHVTLGFDRVVTHGINAIRQEVDVALTQQEDVEKRAFLISMQHCLDAFALWHKRYLTALETFDGAYTAQMRKNLETVPFSAASNFYEAVQSLWFTFAFTRLCGNWSGIGRIDMILGPYLEQDLAQGVLTLEEAREILSHFFIKGCEWITGESNGTGDAQHYQNIVLSGIDENGEDITNVVTYLVLDIVEELNISDFPIAVRVNKQIPQELITKMAEVIRHGGGVVAVYNEELIINSLTSFGYQLKDARRFANDGCWEVQIPGETCFVYEPFDGLEILQKETLASYQKPLEFTSFEQLYQQYRTDLQKHIETMFKSRIEAVFDYTKGPVSSWKWKPAVPCTVVSLFTKGCIQKGLSYLEGGAKYNVNSPHIGGLPDIANSLYAIKKLVFEEKRLTLQALLNILKDNWKNEEALRQYIVNHYHFYGNDNDEVDEIAARLLSDYADIVMNFNGKSPLLYPPGVSTFGRQIEWSAVRLAAPHGRKQGDILSGNLSPTPGSDAKGATSIIKSHCKANLAKQVSGVALDIKLYPSAAKGENGVQAIAGLIKAFVSLGGFFMQVDVIDNEILKRAQENPEEYKTLAVRVSGWSARFVTLNKQWQEMIIERENGNI